MEVVQKETALTTPLKGHLPAQYHALMEKNYELSKVQCSKSFLHVNFQWEVLCSHTHIGTHTKKFCALYKGIPSPQLKEQLRLKQNSSFRKVVFYILSQLSRSWNCHISLTETSCGFFSVVCFVASCPSQIKYRQKPESLKFTAVVDSPSLIHAKTSYLQCNDVGFILMYN